MKSKKPAEAKDAAAKPPKLTADQILANQTLESAESQARGLEAPMRSYSLAQIALAFAASDPAKARTLLRDAFSASLAIDNDAFAKENIQQEIFRTLLPVSQEDVEERLMQAESRPRRQAVDALISRYIEKKQFSKATDLIQQTASLDELPYEAASRLLQVLPVEMNGEKQTLFASAVVSYRAHDHKGLSGDTSFTKLVLRFGDGVPPKLALEAIDENLSEARAKDGNYSVIVGGSGGSAAFSSEYEYQLFYLLPLLSKLDESRANHLLEENASLKSTMQQYPNGVDSVSPPPAFESGPNPPQRGISVNVNGNGAKASNDEVVRQELQRRADLILKLADTDPTQAIAQATALPLTINTWMPPPRVTTLEAVARLSLKKQPAAAHQAVAEMRKAAANLPPRDQMKYVSSAADMYLQMDDKDSVDSVVSEGLGVAAKLLDSDTNPDNPNKALKAWWPSSDAYRRLVDIESKMSHPATAKMLQEIKDPDIRTVESIMFARALLGIPMKRVIVQEKTKDGNRSRSFDGP